MSIAEDEQAIRDLAARYTDAINRADGVAAASVYTPDGVLETAEGVKVRGMEKLVRAFRNLVEERRACLFQMTHSSVIKVDGDRAEARFWFSEIKKHTDDGRWHCVFGCYQDVAVRTDVGWRFIHRRPGSLVTWTPPSEGLEYSEKPPFLDLGMLAMAARAPAAE